MDVAKFAGQAVEHLPVPFLALEAVQDDAGREDLEVVWANPPAHDRFGDEIVGRWLDRDAVLGTTEPILTGTSHPSGTARVIERTARRDGRTEHLRCTVVPTDSSCIAMMIEDITSEAATRAELAMVGSTLARVERRGNLGVWEADLDSGSIYWSTQVFEILGLDEPGFDEYRRVVHPDDLPMVEHLLSRVNDQPGPYHINHRIVRGDEIRTVDQHVQSVPDQEGRPVRLIGTIVDVTAAHALAQQVHHTQKMRSLGLLAGGLAHDFNNVLMVVRGHADLLLKRTPEDDRNRPSLESIARAGERASILTRKLMALGRQEELRPTSVTPARFLSEVAELVGPAVEADDVVLEVDAEASAASAEVLADADQLGQVVIDLVLNARDAGARHVVLRFDLVQVRQGDPVFDGAPLPPGAYGAIRVVDDGGGMDEATRRRIFEPFFTTKDTSSGSGLGLANAQSFAQRSSGALVAESEPGSGTTMSLLLPIPAQPDVTEKPARAPRSHTRLLVVAGDDRGEQLAAALDHLGHQLVRVDSLDAMTFSLATEPIDLVVADGALLPAGAPPSLDSVPSVVVDEHGSGAAVAYDDADGLRTAVDDLLGRP